MDRRTRQRQAIETAIDRATGPVTPAAILSAASDALPSMNLSTVYRTLARMVEEGKAVTVQLPGEPVRYQRRSTPGTHRHHFRCTRCDAVFDLKGCVKGLARLLPPGFRMTGHDITLYGLCHSCA